MCMDNCLFPDFLWIPIIFRAIYWTLERALAFQMSGEWLRYGTDTTTLMLADGTRGRASAQCISSVHSRKYNFAGRQTLPFMSTMLRIINFEFTKCEIVSHKNMPQQFVSVSPRPGWTMAVAYRRLSRFRFLKGQNCNRLHGTVGKVPRIL